MKTIRLLLCIFLAALAPRLALADIVGNYTSDANTLFLVHFDEAAGGTVATNKGSKAGNFYTVVNSTTGNGTATPPTVTVMLGAPSYVNGATNFNNCLTNPAAGDFAGFDFDKSGAFQGDVSSATQSPDRLAMTNLNMGNGANSPFTLEAIIRPTLNSGNQEIICTDNSLGNSTRGFQLRMTASQLQFQFVGGTAPTAASATIPTTGNDAFVAGNWYHVAAAYDGANVTLYWTLLNPTNGAAHILGSPVAMSFDTARGAVVGPLVIGNDDRNSSGEQFVGCIDEVRISSVARGSGQMQFYSPLVSITANPVSQNVDYNQPVTFSVGASSQFPLGYQWRYNSTPIPGATTNTYSITNVAANNAGAYDCVVTNTIGFSATSSAGTLVVGAANFLADRYSFTTDTTDSIGGKTGTNFGAATVTGGALVLDGTSGTYMQLPPALFNSANATALTVEFWATYGVNGNFVRVFDFGYTNVVGGIVGINYVGYSPRNGSGGNQLHISPSDGTFQQTAAAAGILDGLTRHVVCVIDPPNKTIAIYTNGVFETANTNMTVNIGNINDQFSYIGRSLFAADPYLNASIDELRIFKGALSAISIKQSDDQGPNTLLADGPAKYTSLPANTSVPAGQTATFTAAAVGYLPLSYQWFKNGTLVSGATNASYSFATVIGDNGATFLVHATNTIGVTTYVTNSAAATLTVFIPSTLAWVDAANGGADNTWDTTSLNWTNNVSAVVAFTQTNGVLFDSRGSGSSLVNLVQAITPYKLTVDAATDYILYSPGGNGSLVGQGSLTKLNSGQLTINVTNNLTGATTISGGTLVIGNGDTFGNLSSGPVTNNATLSFNRSDALAVPNIIHGSGTVSVDSSGSVVVSGASDYTGNTVINVGVLNLQSSTGLGATSSGTTVVNGGQLYITANVDVGAEALTLNGVGDSNGALRKGGAGLTTYNGAVTLASDSTIGLDGGATLVLSNVVSGTAALTAVGGGALTLSTNNSFSGGFILNGSVVNVGAAGALGSGPATVSGTGRFVIGTGLTLAKAITATTVSPGALTGLIMVTDNTNGTVTTVSGPLTFNATAANGGHFYGPLSSGRLDVTGPVTNSSTGVISSRDGFVRFSGGGDYTLFVVNQGTASLGANNGVCPNASISIGASGGATFDLNGFNQALTGLNDGAANAKLVTNSAATLSTLTMNLAAASTYSGVIAGKLALVANGTGSLLLSGTNNYTGNTTVNGGTLELAVASIATNTTVTVAAGATLQLDFIETNRIASLVLNGVAQTAGVYNTTTSPTFITGSGSLLVAPSVSTTSTNIVAKVNGGNLELTWPADHTGWRLQVQTNALASGLNTNWSDVPGAASVNSVTNIINAANGSVFYRMVYP
ncbi:MAG: hypothetical protein RL616_627 [Verrucomicrobiota bacterium]